MATTPHPAIAAKTRPAKDADSPFAWKLYSEVIGPMMEPHIRKLRGMGWDPGVEEKLFSKIWDPKKVLIIEIDDGPIGWVSVDSGENAVRIENIYILGKYRDHGLGTHLVKWLFSQYKGRPFAATIIDGSRSRKFFEALGFKATAKLGFEIQLVRPA